MNLHAMVRGAVTAVNPDVDVQAQVSAGYDTSASGTRTPKYATPGIYTGSIDGNTLTISSVQQGSIRVGQTLSGAGITSGTTVTAYGTGGGGVGTYTVDKAQTVSSTTINASLTLRGQIQPLSSTDIQHIEGLNIQGTKRAVYLQGEIDDLVRVKQKGGDVLIFPDGTVWLVAIVLEQWEDWCKVAVTQQNAIIPGFGPNP